jgi:hypothetical protein
MMVALAGSSSKAGIVAGTLASTHTFTVRAVSFSAAGFSGIFVTLSSNRILVAVGTAAPLKPTVQMASIKKAKILANIEAFDGKITFLIHGACRLPWRPAI